MTMNDIVKFVRQQQILEEEKRKVDMAKQADAALMRRKLREAQLDAFLATESEVL
jgi:hypothetical protein